jgi:hypothetical protein
MLYRLSRSQSLPGRLDYLDAPLHEKERLIAGVAAGALGRPLQLAIEANDGLGPVAVEVLVQVQDFVRGAVPDRNQTSGRLEAKGRKYKTIRSRRPVE